MIFIKNAYVTDPAGGREEKADILLKDGKIVTVKKGEGFAQGIFLEYGITEDDNVSQIRNGGFGSTDKK